MFIFRSYLIFKLIFRSFVNRDMIQGSEMIYIFSMLNILFPSYSSTCICTTYTPVPSSLLLISASTNIYISRIYILHISNNLFLYLSKPKICKSFLIHNAFLTFANLCSFKFTLTFSRTFPIVFIFLKKCWESLIQDIYIYIYIYIYKINVIISLTVKGFL